MATPAKPWPVATFEKLRPDLTLFVNRSIIPLLEDTECRRIILRAPVKCGKREMVEYIAMRDLVAQPTRIHAFLSAWHRAADEDQRAELGKQNLRVFSITTQKKVDECLNAIRLQLARGKRIVLHLDECDHGSGAKQMLSKVWEEVRQHERITNILYSATPEEVLFSGEVEDEEHRAMMEDMLRESHRVKYTPPDTDEARYCGPARFLQEGLVHEAIPFFYKEGDTYKLSAQGLQIVGDLRASIAATPARNLVVLRLSYSDLGGKKEERKQNKSIHQFLGHLSSFPELAGFSIVVDKGEGSIRYAGVRSHKIEWSSRGYWDDLATGKPIMLVIDQTSSRSTEWACHDRIFATHDFRNVLQYSTISQAQERVNHYEQKYGGFQRILVYGNIKTFKLSAGQIDYGTYLNHDWLAHKVNVRSAEGGAELYRVKARVAPHALHPKCPEGGLSKTAADRLRQELGCYADTSISARVVGAVRDVRTYTAAWRAATPETFPAVWAAWQRDPENTAPVAEGTRDGTRNPFDAAKDHKLGEIWQGQHRGWKVLDFVDGDLYERPTPGNGLAAPKKLDLGSTGGNRVKVCYKDGSLGIFIARCTGVRREESLRAYKSMYGSD
jgi:hypothetical protein